MTKILTLGMLAGMLLIGCGGPDADTLPPGYKLVCSTEGDKYSLIMPSKYGGRVSANVWDTAGAARHFAWEWEKFKDEPFRPDSAKYNWVECDR